MSGFVYIWRDRKKNRFYIGSHWGIENDGYICSSTWMKQAYRNRPQDFKRRIIFQSDNLTRKELLLEEYKWLALIKQQELGKRYYNLKIGTAHWSADPNSLLTVGEKISLANKGKKKKSPGPRTPEQRDQIRKRQLGRKQSEETIQKRITTMKQKAVDNPDWKTEYLEKISKTSKGRRTFGIKQSEETKEKRSQALKLAWQTGKFAKRPKPTGIAA